MAKYLNDIQVFNNIEASENVKSKSLTITQNASVGGNLTVTGNLTINGTTTTMNTATMTVTDPVITLGGTAPLTVNDNKDRGIEYRWHNGTTSKLGFFGYDASEGKFTFIPDATNTNEVFGGAVGTIKANLDGNAGTVTNGVYTNGSYTDPTWLTISKSKVGLTNVEDTALSTWVGSANITTLGTITSGTWSGTTIAVNKGGTGATTLTSTGILVGNGTSAISAPGPKLTATAFTFGGAGSILSTTTNAITVDSGTTGAVNIGTSNHAKTINIGTGTGTKTIVLGNTDTSTTIKLAKLNSAGFVKTDANGVLSVDTTGYTTNTGTVTSVGLSVPTGLTVTGSPITTSGTLAITLTSGYSIPTTTNQTNWSSAYTATNNATDVNTANTLVKRDASGDIKVGKINELTLTKQTTGFTIAGGTTSKTLTVNNTITLSGTDSSTLNIGSGGTLGTGAFAPKYVHPTGDGNLHVPTTGTTNNGKFLMAGSTAGSLSWGTPTDTNYYPTTFAWADGGSAGPTGSLTGTGMSAVSIGAIPSATASVSGIITTGAQSFAGEKSFSGTIVSTNTSTSLKVNVANTDTDIIRINGSAKTGSSADYGFSLRYLGTLSANENALALYADNQAGTNVESFRIKQDGTIHTPRQITSTVATGTAPFVITSTTAVTNLNADLLDGQHSSAFALASHGTHVSYYGSNPSANGTASAGVSDYVSRGDHVHPTDTTRASSSHDHGNITNAGKIGVTGNLLVYTGTDGMVSALGTGTNGQVLKLSNGKPTWSNEYSYTHPIGGGGSQTGLSGAVVISGITVNPLGHVTETTTRSMTLADLGYTGATNATANTGTVTSVGLSVPIGLTVTGSPITTSGTLAITLTSGYSIPTTANQTNWSSAYTATNSATDANTASTLVKRSASGDIKVGKINELTLTKQNTGFTIAGGTTSKVLTVTENVTIAHSTHASGSDNQTITSGNGMDFTTGSGNITITLGTPSDVSTSSGNTVSSKTHTHKLVLPSTMPPSSHTHGKITNAGKIGSTGNLLVYTGSDGELNALTTGSNNQILKLVSGVPTWSAEYSYGLPTASASTLGGVKIGSGVTIASGVISVSTNYQAPLTSASGAGHDILNSNVIRGLTAGSNITLATANNVITITAKDTTYSNFIASGATAKAGLVPAPSTTAGATKYLREDGTWVVPPNTNTTYTAEKGITLTSGKFGHSNTAITAGTISDGGSSRPLAFGGTFNIPSVTYDAYGHITGTTSITLTMPANPNTDTKYTAGDGINLNSTTFSLGTPSDLSAGTSSAVTNKTHTHAITTTALGAVSTIVKTGTDGSVTASNKFNLGSQASMLYNATSKTIDFVFA